MELPIGTIILWDKSTIPDKWSLCDGTNGTPDLRDRFILGASNDLEIKSTGGAISHKHDYADTQTSNAGAHGHNSFTSDSTTPYGTNGVKSGGNNVSKIDHKHSITVSFGSHGNHNHTISTQTNSADNIPVYIKLAYIMRISD